MRTVYHPVASTTCIHITSHHTPLPHITPFHIRHITPTHITSQPALFHHITPHPLTSHHTLPLSHQAHHLRHPTSGLGFGCQVAAGLLLTQIAPPPLTSDHALTSPHTSLSHIGPPSPITSPYRFTSNLTLSHHTLSYHITPHPLPQHHPHPQGHARHPPTNQTT